MRWDKTYFAVILDATKFLHIGPLNNKSSKTFEMTDHCHQDLFDKGKKKKKKY